MSSRPTLAQIRRWVRVELDDEWRTPTDFQHLLGLPGSDWYRVALVLERLAADGFAELRAKRGSSRRKFRRCA